MSQVIVFDGQTHVFPDDFKQSDIATALSSPEYQRSFTDQNTIESARRAAPITGFTDQVLHNLGVGDEITGGVAALKHVVGNIIGGKPVGDLSATYNGAVDAERGHALDYSDVHPFLNALATVGGAAAGGAPAIDAATMRALPIARQALAPAALRTAAVTAPLELAQQDGDPLQRFQKAAPSIGVAGLLGGAGQGLSNALGATVGSPAATRAAQFAQAGVRPTLTATMSDDLAGPTKAIAENWLAGGGARRNIAASLDDTRAAAARLAGQYGAPTTAEDAGGIVNAGVQRFARDSTQLVPSLGAPASASSFSAKAGALYNAAFKPIQASEQMIVRAGHPSPIDTKATQGVLQSIFNRAPNVSDLTVHGDVQRVQQAVASAKTFDDLRGIRSWVREQQGPAAALQQGIDSASLQRLEGGLTQDIRQSATNIAGPQASAALKRADTFYRAGQQRIGDALKPFGDATSPARAYVKITQMAAAGGSQNTTALQALRRSLRPEEWRDVAATVVAHLGDVTKGSPNALEPGAFSVDRFVTNYAGLSQEGRQVLFGGPQTGHLANALDNLAKVGGYQKAVERAANASKSGVSMQNIGTIGGLMGVATTVPTVLALIGASAAGHAMTNPAFVRWLSAAPRVAGRPGGWAGHLQTLAQLASKDPALAPVYARLAPRLTSPADATAPGPAQTPGRPSPALQP